MKRGDEQYPDGAMLGKVAFATEEDPSFPNSLQPFLLTRVQFMRKNVSDYSASDGWGCSQRSHSRARGRSRIFARTS